MRSEFRYIDRMFYRCDEMKDLKISEYPMLDAYKLDNMYSVARSFPDDAFIFAFVKNTESNEPFIEIYMCKYEDNYENFYKRYVWKKGTRLLQEDEDSLMECLDSEVFYSEANISRFVNDCVENFPEVYFTGFSKKSLNIKYMYFAIHEGNMERVYKARLFNIAEYLERGEINDLAVGSGYTSPSKLFELPMRLLIILDKIHGIEYLKTKETRKTVLKIYNKYRDFLDTEDVWPYQIKYLYDIENGNINLSFDKSVYKFLREMICEDTYLNYMRYLQVLEDSVKDYYPVSKTFSCEEDYIQKTKTVFYLETLISREFNINNGFDIVRCQNERLEYEDDDYKVEVVSSLMDMSLLAFKQKNCLVSYIEKSAGGQSVILSMKSKDELDKSIVSIEYVKDKNMLTQALGKMNRELTDKERTWLLNYCKIKGIELSNIHKNICTEWEAF